MKISFLHTNIQVLGRSINHLACIVRKSFHSSPLAKLPFSIKKHNEKTVHKPAKYFLISFSAQRNPPERTDSNLRYLQGRVSGDTPPSSCADQKHHPMTAIQRAGNVGITEGHLLNQITKTIPFPGARPEIAGLHPKTGINASIAIARIPLKQAPARPYGRPNITQQLDNSRPQVRHFCVLLLSRACLFILAGYRSARTITNSVVIKPVE